MRLHFLIILFALTAVCAPAYAQDNSLVREFFYKSDYAGCIREGQKLLATAPWNIKDELYDLVGLSALKQGDWRLASDMFTRLLGEYPRSSQYADEARLGIADSLLIQGDLKQARQKYLDFIAKRPSSKLKAQAYFRVMLCARRSGDRAQEFEYRTKLLDEFPDSSEAKLDQDIFPAPSFTPSLVIEPAAPVVVSSPKPETEYQVVLAPQSVYSVQVGAFSKPANAQSLADKLKRGGFAAITDTVRSRDKVIYKVKVGELATYAEAKKLERRLSSLGYPTKITP